MTMPPKPVTWISPVVLRHAFIWPHSCEAELVTPEARSRSRPGSAPPKCNRNAKINFRGVKMCVRHASMAALKELAGEMPEVAP